MTVVGTVPPLESWERDMVAQAILKCPCEDCHRCAICAGWAAWLMLTAPVIDDDAPEDEAEADDEIGAPVTTHADEHRHRD